MAPAISFGIKFVTASRDSFLSTPNANVQHTASIGGHRLVGCEMASCAALTLLQHLLQHGSERPILLAVDQELAVWCGLSVRLHPG